MWIIQDKVFGEDQAKLESACNALIFPYQPKHNFDYFDRLREISGEQIIPRGSVDFVQRIQREPLLTINNYSCTTYYNKFLPWMLNRDHFLVPWGVFVSDCYDGSFNYFKALGADRLFIRPNVGKKIFTGNYITKKWYNEDIKTIISLQGNSEPKEDDLILVSSYKEDIVSEIRVLVHKNRSIDSSLYYGECPIFRVKALEVFVNIVVDTANWYPDDFWVMDVALMENNDVKIVEINNLFSSGWYDCDHEKVVKYIEENI